MIKAKRDAISKKKASVLRRCVHKMRQTLLHSAFSLWKSTNLALHAAERDSESLDKLFRYLGNRMQASVKTNTFHSWKENVLFLKNQKQKTDSLRRNVRSTIQRRVCLYNCMLQRNLRHTFSIW